MGAMPVRAGRELMTKAEAFDLVRRAIAARRVLLDVTRKVTEAHYGAGCLMQSSRALSEADQEFIRAVNLGLLDIGRRVERLGEYVLTETDEGFTDRELLAAAKSQELISAYDGLLITDNAFEDYEAGEDAVLLVENQFLILATGL
jgi:hypothetical protein